MRRSRTLLRVGLAGSSVALALLAGEIVARIMSRANRSIDYMPFFDLLQDDPEVGWRHHGDWSFTLVTEDGDEIEARTSREGFCTPSVPSEREPQLVTIGDSFLAGFWHTRRPIASVIQDELGVPVYNLAVGGLGPESYRAMYEKFATGRNHEVALVFSFVNDITDVINWHAWKQSGEPSFRQWLHRANPGHFDGNDGVNWLDRHSRLWNLAKYRVRGRGGSSTSRGPALEPFAPSGAPTYEMWLGTSYPFMTLDPDAFMPGGSYFDSMTPYLESLDRLKESIERNGARMVLVWIPSKERVHLPLLAPERRAELVTNATGRIDGLETVIALYARERGLSFLDLSGPLGARAAEGEKLYFTLDGHFNASGNEVVGEIVSRFVRELPEPPPPIEPGARTLLPRHEITVPLPLADARDVSSIAHVANDRVTVQGRAASPFAYLMRWDATTLETPGRLVVRGTIHRGGFTLGLLDEDGSWYVQRNVEGHGPFERTLDVPVAGTYSVVLANCLRGDSLENHVDISAIGWTSASAPETDDAG